MKIASSNLDLQSSHAQSRQLEVKESLRMWVGQRPPEQRQAANPPAMPRSTVNISDAARAHHANEANAIEQASSDIENHPEMQLLISLVEAMTGHKVRLYKPDGEKGAEAPPPAPVESGSEARRPAGFGVEYDRTETYSESETTTLHASGTIKTADGKEISFNLDLAMQRHYVETRSESIRLGDAVRKTDPLVINFSGTAAQLQDQRFAFDLNSDGQDEQINVLASGSGYLALDANADGKVNNGNELFGTTSGNGFADLAKYDSDRNGWIDENDPVFKQLKVWTQDTGSSGTLSSLAEKGVGAISLAAVSTPFDIKNSNNQLLGSVRSSGVVLNENGMVGTVQQIDLTA